MDFASGKVNQVVGDLQHQQIHEGITIQDMRPADIPALAAFLTAGGLPTAGLDQSALGLIARSGEAVVGCAALEHFGTRGLLRSVAVAAAWRNHGLGARIVAGIEDAACKQGISTLYLLTETAVSYFEGLGYSPVSRAEISGPVTQSVEFVSACPASAQAMVKQIA